MKSIKEILENNTDIDVSVINYESVCKLERLNNQKGNLTDYDCDICLNKGLVYSKVLINGYEEIIVNDCECQTIRKINRTIKDSGLQEQFVNQTLNNFKVSEKWQKEIIKRAVEFIDEGSNYWFYIGGQIGSGKTHISTAISKELIDKGNTFKYLRYASDFTSLQKRMRSGYPDIRENAEHEMNMLLNVDVLYIDDLLKIKNTDNLFELIDGRYIRDKITIFSSELRLREINNIDAAIGTRIYEKTKHGKYLIQIDNDNQKNYRLRK